MIVVVIEAQASDSITTKQNYLFGKGTTMTNATIVAAPITTQAAASSATANNPLANIFRLKTGTTAVSPARVPVLSASVVTAVSAADDLFASYDNLKATVLDRSDRALWTYLQEIYTYVQAIKGTALEDDICNELIRKIILRGGPNTSPSVGIGAVVVRYIFADASRQTWNNYNVAMKKAAAMGVTTDTFAAFLEQYGGVSKVVENTFDYEAKQLAFNADTNKMIRAEKQSRTELIGRLYNVMAHTSQSQIDYSGELSNWVLEKPKKAAKADGKEDKVDPKYQQGDFVLFMTVRDPEAGKYRVVQGNVFDRAFEAQLLSTIADRMGAETKEMEMAVADLEQQIGFNAAE